MKAIFFRSALLACVCTVVSISCTSDDDGSVSMPETNLDPALVGTWEGQISTDFGDSDIALEFTSNGSITELELSNPVYCSIPDFKWYVSGNSVKMQGTESCDDHFINVTAPYSTTTLNGTFSAINGTPGTITITKQ